MPAPLTQGGLCFCANAMRYCRSPCLPCARGGAERSEAEGLQAKAGCVCDPGRRRRKGCRSPSPRKKAAAQRRCRAAQPLRYRGISTPQSFSAKMPAPLTQGGLCFSTHTTLYCRNQCLPCARGGVICKMTEGLSRKKPAAQRRCRAAQPLLYREISTPQSFSAKMPAPLTQGGFCFCANATLFCRSPSLPCVREPCFCANAMLYCRSPCLPCVRGGVICKMTEGLSRKEAAAQRSRRVAQPLLYRGISTPQSFSSKMPAPLTQGGLCFCANAMLYCRSPCLPCARGGVICKMTEGLSRKKVVAQRRRCEGVYNRAAAASAVFCGEEERRSAREATARALRA